MTISDLDTFRADAMRCMLDDRGRREVWKYDIIKTQDAHAEACAHYNFDNIQINAEAICAGKAYALVGPGICDAPFNTPAELLMLVFWLCVDGGYLSCYARPIWRWQPHLEADRQALALIIATTD